jgi:hypothetical protein
MEAYLTALGITLGLLCLGGLALLWMILQALQALNRELAGLRVGLEGLNRFGGALGSIGDDLEAGRQQVQWGVSALKALVGPWLGKLG